jgi:hypothetical protein
MAHRLSQDPDMLLSAGAVQPAGLAWNQQPWLCSRCYIGAPEKAKSIAGQLVSAIKTR